MKLYILLKDGQPYLHPIVEENFIENYNAIKDYQFVEFIRKPLPNLNVYEVLQETRYEWNGDVVEDVHIVRPMTTEEKTALQQQVKESWAKKGYKSWIFNEEFCVFDPPFPAPDDGKEYCWDEEGMRWVELREFIGN